jgi:hypothetical protein
MPSSLPRACGSCGRPSGRRARTRSPNDGPGRYVVRPGTPNVGLPQPLGPEVLEQAVRLATTPERRLLLVLAVVHAARPIAIRQLTLGDLDLPNRRITIAGRAADSTTSPAIPSRTTSPPAAGAGPTPPTRTCCSASRPATRTAVGDRWLRHRFRGLGVTLNWLRMDRQLEEALVHGPDALHLMAVFGTAENTAVRYANAARQLLVTDVERGEPTSPTPTAPPTQPSTPGGRDEHAPQRVCPSTSAGPRSAR